MIADLKIIDDETAEAVGERYDLAKVLDAMCGIVDDFAALAKTRGEAQPYTQTYPGPPRPGEDWVVRLFREAEMPIQLPYGPHTPRLIRMKVGKEKEWVDAGGLRQSVEAPPYRFDLYPLGTEPLYANFGMCRVPGIEAEWITCEGRPWTDFDPSPIVRIFRHLPLLLDDVTGKRPEPDLHMTKTQRKTLTAFLETQRHRGIDFETGAGGLATEPIKLIFPHDRFGLGRGPIRIALLRDVGD